MWLINFSIFAIIVSVIVQWSDGASIQATRESTLDRKFDLKASANDNGGGGGATTSTTTGSGNGNVYGADGDGGGASGKPTNRGYNQGYSYNTGIKPYTTGYTYYQPFGDAVNQDNNQSNSNGDSKPGAPGAPQQLPVDLGSMFGIDPKQMGPVKVIPNQNVPVDENGIPILDAIKIPNNNGGGGGGGAVVSQPAPVPVHAVQQQQQQQPNPNDFNMPTDFNLNNILGSSGSAGNTANYNNNNQNRNNNNNNGMFDFAPPDTANFDFGTPRGNDQSDYNRLDNFAGNLNNFDTYLGDGSLMMNNPNRNQPTGFGFGGQQVPSEIVNLNNAFGTGANTNSNNQFNDILNQFGANNGGGNGGGGSPGSGGGGDGIDFGNFGAASNDFNNQMFPFF